MAFEVLGSLSPPNAVLECPCPRLVFRLCIAYNSRTCIEFMFG